MEQSLQDIYGPETICFGCGPANADGLRIKSYPDPDSDDVVCDFDPAPHHQAFPGVINGGIIGTLLDCHSNWTAAYHFLRARDGEQPPVTVTADFHVKLRRPTPAGETLHLHARVVETSGDDRVVVDAEIEAAGKITATCRGTFVAVEEGHPAWHRW
jgi:acyl-coenzyme A thioesterase PaaI-like protein